MTWGIFIVIVARSFIEGGPVLITEALPTVRPRQRGKPLPSKACYCFGPEIPALGFTNFNNAGRKMSVVTIREPMQMVRSFPILAIPR
jgi:hypothetical protein